MTLLGYTRVSTTTQDASLQRTALLEAAPLERVVPSGKAHEGQAASLEVDQSEVGRCGMNAKLARDVVAAERARLFASKEQQHLELLHRVDLLVDERSKLIGDR